jgi:hypothetical protein
MRRGLLELQEPDILPCIPRTTLLRFNWNPSINFEVETCGQINNHDAHIVFTMQGTYNNVLWFVCLLYGWITTVGSILWRTFVLPEWPIKQIMYCHMSVNDSSDWNVIFVIEDCKRSILYTYDLGVGPLLRHWDVRLTWRVYEAEVV